jgi:putative hemin transport protein
MTNSLTAADIRAAKAENPKTRDRDLAAQLGISEGELLAAQVGVNGVTRINPHPDALMPEVSKLGEVMALTRNESAVHERVGTWRIPLEPTCLHGSG